MSPGPQLWQQQATPRQNTGSTLSYTHDETTKQWSFIGFEWVVRNVRKLREFVEQVPGETETETGTVDENGQISEQLEADDFEILKQSPILGDHKFKLEISRTSPGQDNEGTSSSPSSLCLYITCLTLDLMPHLELPTAMMIAIKCQDDRMGEKGARPDWVWVNWQQDFVFRQDSEVWDCPLPPLSELLQNSRIKDTDSMVICLQIHSPGLVIHYPSHPSAYYVPRDLLDGLEASLDNPNTGDVRFVCLERLKADSEVSSPPVPASEAPTSPTTFRSPSSTSTVSHSSPFSGYTTARKRIIYAHSDILIRRSEYFATMLASSFAETNPQGVAPGERKLYTVVVEEADFETIYWLLKFCYANWLLFKEHDDPRAAVDGIGAGWSAKWLTQNQGHRGEWDWKTFTKSGNSYVQDGDTKSATSGESMTTAESAISPATAKGGKTLQAPSNASPPRTSNAPARTPTSSTTAKSSTRPTITPRRPANNSTTTATGSMALSMSSSARSKPIPVPLSIYPISPNSQRRGGHGKSNMLFSTPDPHMHPTPPPPPASALSMYYLAHRYDMPGLSNLALEHMMSTLTPESSFALLLASHAWEDLRALVEDYIVEKWDEVSVTAEFERCCQEVAAGEWGPEGGTTMTALFRRLRSPNAIFSRA